MAEVALVLRHHVQSALRALTRGRSVSDKRIHDARKAIKRARAALRVLRDAMGVRRYRQLNRALRDAARPLTHVRDAKVLPDALVALRDRNVDAWHGIEPDWIERGLRRNRTRARRDVLGDVAILNRSRLTLRRTAASLRAMRLRPGWPGIESAVRRVYRAARHARRRAHENPTDEALHEGRKRVKYLWHTFQILQSLCPGVFDKPCEQAHRLADHLGDDHDLAVLRAWLITEAGMLEIAKPDALLALLDARRRELQHHAWTEGSHLLEERPRQFVRRLQECEQ